MRRGAAQENGGAGGEAAVENVVIVGSGPAGYTAAIYASRASLRPLLFEGVSAGGVPGGQLMTTTEVENFPGFPEGITGPDLMERMRQQAVRWGAELLTEDVVSLDLNNGQPPFRVVGTDTEVHANAVIVATGATAKRLGLPSEHTFWSRGISACAICDGASPLFKRKPVAVVGGGDTALEEALYLTKYASKVYLLVRSSMRASMAMQERVVAHPDIEIVANVTCEDVEGDPKTGAMNAVRVVPTDGNGEPRTIHVAGIFYGIGHSPNSGLLDGQVKLDDAGYVVVEDGCRTSLPGVFCAGDLHDTEWRQAITAAGSGCMAAIAAERHLAEHNLVVHKPSAEGAESAARKEVAQANAAAAQSEQTDAELVAENKETFDIDQTYHRGQFALRKLYHESPRAIVKVLYTAPTCGPCRALKPIIRKAVGDVEAEHPNGVHFIEIDIEEDPEIAEAAGVTGTPTVHIFKDKARIEVLSGVKAKSEYKRIMLGHITGGSGTDDNAAASQEKVTESVSS